MVVAVTTDDHAKAIQIVEGPSNNIAYQVAQAIAAARAQAIEECAKWHDLKACDLREQESQLDTPSFNAANTSLIQEAKFNEQSATEFRRALSAAPKAKPEQPHQSPNIGPQPGEPDEQR